MTNVDCLNCGTVTSHEKWTGPTGWYSFRVCHLCGSEGLFDASMTSPTSDQWIDFDHAGPYRQALHG